MTQINLNVRQVTRIEGHGNIVLKASDGGSKSQVGSPESPRFFEAMLRAGTG